MGLQIKVVYLDTIQPTINHLVEMGKDLKPLTDKIGDRVLRDMQIAHRMGVDPETGAPWPASSSSRGMVPLHGDSGRLLGHFFQETMGSKHEVISIYNDIEYAGPQQRGDKVTPKNHKFLAIPTDSLSQAERSMAPKMFPNTWVMPSKGSPGVFVIMQRLDSPKGQSYQCRAIFSLVKSVQLKKRNMLGVPEGTWPIVEDIVVSYANRMAA